MRTLVTGATGYLGAELVRALRERDREVRALVRSPAAAARLDGTGAEIAEGDVLDDASLDRALDGVTRVFHMAGVVGHRASDEPRLRAVNVDGARAVLAACTRAGVERVVFTSSVATVGPAGGPGHPRDEGAWLIDGDDGRVDFRYGRTKAAGEQAALEAAAGGLDVVITNPGFVIGPGDVHRVSSWPVEEYMRGRLRFTVPGGLSYVDVRDVVAGHLLAEERGRSGERYILTNDDGNLSHRDFFALVGRVTGRPRRQVQLSAGMLRPVLRTATALRLPVPLDDQELASSCHWWFCTAAKARAELGFATRPIAETIRDTAEWLRADGYHKH
ncbi:MAG TPA: NAD-dependent epimerase/dehydratase family protein [Gaiellales bacterium]|jgi:dihydroflavonol-4-reductase